MRLHSIFSEAWRNLIHGTSRAFLWSVVLALGLGGLAALDGLRIAEILGDVTKFRAAGADITVVQTETLIDGAACDRLSQTPGVQGAGAVARSEYITLPGAPNSPLQTYLVSPHMAAVLHVVSNGETGVWMATQQAEQLGLQLGDSIPSSAGNALHLTGTFPWPQDGRDARFRFAVLIPTQPATQLFDECWMRAWPHQEDVQALLMSTVMVGSGLNQAQTAKVNATLGQTLDATTRFQTRTTSWVALVCPLAGIACGWASSRVRRLEFASSLHVGQTHTGLGLTVALETIVIAMLATVLASQALWLILRFTGTVDLWPVFLVVGRGIVAGSSAFIVGAVAATASTRERHLFRYFKKR